MAGPVVSVSPRPRLAWSNTYCQAGGQPGKDDY